MITRRFHFSLLGLAGLTVVLRAATPVTPPAGLDPKGALPVAPPPTAIKSTEPSTPIGGAADAGAPAAKTALEPASATTPPPVTGAPEVTKPGILSAAKAKGPPTAKTSAVLVPLSPRFQLTRTHIAALFDTRNAPPAPIDPLANPFRSTGAAPVVPSVGTEGTTPLPVALNSDLTSLQQAVATLRVKGTVQRGKTLQLVITSAPGKEGTYKEGDIINVLLPPGDPVHLRVRQISTHSVTLTINDAEMVLKF